MSGIPGTAVVQVTNLSSAVSSEQMRTLFSFLGDIEELRLYPPDNTSLSFSSKVCYIKYRDPSSVGVAQHLTNTVFIDRALIVVPCVEGVLMEILQVGPLAISDSSYKYLPQMTRLAQLLHYTSLSQALFSKPLSPIGPTQPSRGECDQENSPLNLPRWTPCLFLFTFLLVYFLSYFPMLCTLCCL
uniref:RRM domain-containing protein n=1 Tax=Monopterus albus TaxID=43700 RepID=A0A3Q3K5M4_MONAL